MFPYLWWRPAHHPYSQIIRIQPPVENELFIVIRPSNSSYKWGYNVTLKKEPS